MARNPFKPTAGKMPPVLIGRNSIVEEFEDALENGPGAPGRMLLLSGNRGYGKTVLLTKLERIAEQQGWDVVSETASKGLVNRIALSLEADRNSALVGAADLQAAIEARLNTLPKGKGLLLTVDEVQAARGDEIAVLGEAVQGLSRKSNKDVAVVFAGLPSVADRMANEESFTFIHTCVQRSVTEVTVAEIAECYRETFRSSGMSIEADVARYAAQQTYGYPYLVQLVGYYLFREAKRRKSAKVEMRDVKRGLPYAVNVYGDAVCAPEYNGCTWAQRTFLDAVAQSYPKPAAMSGIAEYAGKSASWASKYRAILIRRGLVRSTRHGYVEFALPHFGQYLQMKGESPEAAKPVLPQSADLSRCEYSFVHWKNGVREVVDIDATTSRRLVVLLDSLIEQGLEGQQLIAEVNRHINLSVGKE